MGTAEVLTSNCINYFECPFCGESIEIDEDTMEILKDHGITTYTCDECLELVELSF